MNTQGPPIVYVNSRVRFIHSFKPTTVGDMLCHFSEHLEKLHYARQGDFITCVKVGIRNGSACQDTIKQVYPSKGSFFDSRRFFLFAYLFVHQVLLIMRHSCFGL